MLCNLGTLHSAQHTTGYLCVVVVASGTAIASVATIAAASCDEREEVEVLGVGLPVHLHGVVFHHADDGVDEHACSCLVIVVVAVGKADQCCVRDVYNGLPNFNVRRLKQPGCEVPPIVVLVVKGILHGCHEFQR